MHFDDPNADNLLVRLFSYTPRLEWEPLENFCTEALAWCLRQSVDFRRRFLALTPIEFREDELSEIKIHTQSSFREHDEANSSQVKGQFDLVIQSSSFVMVIEVKIGSPVDGDQINKYRQRINQYKEYKQRYLLILTRNQPQVGKSNYEKDECDGHITWPMVENEVNLTVRENREKTLLNAVSPISLEVLEMFAHFLKEKGLGKMKIDEVNQEKLSSLFWADEFRADIKAILESVQLNGDGFDRKTKPRVIEQKKEGWMASNIYPMPSLQPNFCYYITAQRNVPFLSMGAEFSAKGEKEKLCLERDIVANDKLREYFSIPREHAQYYDKLAAPGCKVDEKDKQLYWFYLKQIADGNYNGNADEMRGWFEKVVPEVGKLIQSSAISGMPLP